MKKLLLASAVAALSVSAAQAAPTVYGKAFLTLDMNKGDSSVVGNERAQLNSVGSRVGFKGSEPLTANTDAVYQLEYGVNVDDANKSQFSSRDTYLGLSNAQYGTVVAGRLSAIDGEVDFANVASGGVLGGNGILASFDAPRADNAVAYFSPDYNGMQYMAMYVMDEGGSSHDITGVAAKYENGPMKLGGSYIHNGDDMVRVSGSYDMGQALTVGALYQMTNFDADGKEKENSLTISGEMKTATPWTGYAQGDMVSNVDGVKNDDAYRVLVGGKYAFNQATTGHVYGAYLNQDNGSNSDDGFGIGGGLEYRF